MVVIFSLTIYARNWLNSIQRIYACFYCAMILKLSKQDKGFKRIRLYTSYIARVFVLHLTDSVARVSLQEKKKYQHE